MPVCCWTSCRRPTAANRSMVSMAAFENSYREYMYYYAQTAALESGLRKVVDDRCRAWSSATTAGIRAVAPLAVRSCSRCWARASCSRSSSLTGYAPGQPHAGECPRHRRRGRKVRARRRMCRPRLKPITLGVRFTLMGTSFEKLQAYALKTITKEEAQEHHRHGDLTVSTRRSSGGCRPLTDK